MTSPITSFNPLPVRESLSGYTYSLEQDIQLKVFKLAVWKIAPPGIEMSHSWPPKSPFNDDNKSGYSRGCCISHRKHHSWTTDYSLRTITLEKPHLLWTPHQKGEGEEDKKKAGFCHVQIRIWDWEFFDDHILAFLVSKTQYQKQTFFNLKDREPNSSNDVCARTHARVCVWKRHLYPVTKKLCIGRSVCKLTHFHPLSHF